MIPNVHMGEIVQQKLDEKERSIAWLAKKTNCPYSSLCKTLKNKYIHYELLFKICIVLDIDFFSLYSNELKEKNKEVFEIK